MVFSRLHPQRVLVIVIGLLVTSYVDGQRLPQTDIVRFEGNRVFSSSELSTVLEKCVATDPQWTTKPKEETVEYCASRLEPYLRSKGYLQAKVTPQRHERNDRPVWSILITEGPLFRLGKLDISGSKVFLPSRLRETLALQSGDIADGEFISAWAFEKLGRLYANLGYIQFSADIQPVFHIDAGASEGTVDFRVYIDEGRAFIVRSIRFTGNDEVSKDELAREMFVRSGEIFSRQLFEESLKKIAEASQFETIDSEKDVDYKPDRESPLLDITIHLKRKKP